MDYIKLFEPITINGLTIKNRIVMPSMGMSWTHAYEFNDRYKGFYRARAKGGVGLMTIGPTAIDRAGSAPFMPSLFDDSNLESFEKFNDELHRTTDVRVATQLFHMGRYAYSFLSGETPIAPSPVPSKLTGETPREMTIEDIERVQDAFVQAAKRAVAVGFDLVEIIACTGYLISQFLSPVTNRRTDEYGGPIENRMRFGLEVIRRVREAVGPNVPLSIRIPGNDFMDGGHTNVEAAMFAAEAEKAGINAINVTGGWHETNIPQLTTNVPPGNYVYLARGVKNKVGIPVWASNRLGNPELAEKALRSGACDMVCWGRPLIADPELPNKVRQGRLDEAVYCIACNQGCFDSIFAGVGVHCVLNPRAGRENDLILEKTTDPKKIMVAGGGPGGMEFAITAGLRGHRVSLYEKSDRLGGQINLAQAPPGKKELNNIITGMTNRLKAAGVDVFLNKEVTPELVDELKPDVLAVATGAVPIAPKFPGSDKPHVVSAWDVLRDRIPDIGRNVVIVGGSATGCETAHHIAALNAPDPETFAFLMYHQAEDQDFIRSLLLNTGRSITVIDLVPRLAENVGRTSRWSLMKSLRLKGVNLRPGTKLIEITDDAVVVETGEVKETIPADTVVMAVGARSLDSLSKEIKSDKTKIITIGDAKQPRKITEAVMEGFTEGLQV